MNYWKNFLVKYNVWNRQKQKIKLKQKSNKDSSSNNNDANESANDEEQEVEIDLNEKLTDENKVKKEEGIAQNQEVTTELASS